MKINRGLVFKRTVGRDELYDVLWLGHSTPTINIVSEKLKYVVEGCDPCDVNPEGTRPAVSVEYRDGETFVTNELELTRQQAEKLIPLLKHYVDTGSLPYSDFK